MMLVFSTFTKKISSQFFDLDIENPLVRGTLLLNSNPSLNLENATLEISLTLRALENGKMALLFAR
jgi:hypothetical protein